MTRFFLAAVLIGSLLTSCTNGTDTRTLDDFVNAFEAEYSLDDFDTPAYEFIGAEAGVMFYVNGRVFKIYQFADTKAYDEALTKFPDLISSMAKNELFVAEASSDSKDLLEFFKSIPKKIKKKVVEDQGEMVAEEEEYDSIAREQDEKRLQDEKRQEDERNLPSYTAEQYYNLWADNKLKAEQLYKGKKMKITGVVREIGKSNSLVSFDELPCVKLESRYVYGTAASNLVCLFPENAINNIINLEKGKKVTIIGYSVDQHYLEKCYLFVETLASTQSNPLLSKYKLTWGASIQTVQEAFAKVWSYEGEETNSLWEPTKDRREDWEQYASVGVRVFCTAGLGDDCFYFYQDKLYKITSYDNANEENLIYFDSNVEKQVQALQEKK